jgi:hypothetical protein
MTERSRAASVAAFVLLGWLAGLSVSPASAADEPDLIFKRSTVFKWLTPDDKLVMIQKLTAFPATSRYRRRAA